MAERATGKSLKELVAERITKPLKINGLQYGLPNGIELLPSFSGKDSILRQAHHGELDIFGPNTLTLRHCFTHTNGFKGHGLFNGVHNPWLENSLSLYIKTDTVGIKYHYNGMGYDLAGKVMEVVSGKSIFRLCRVC